MVDGTVGNLKILDVLPKALKDEVLIEDIFD